MHFMQKRWGQLISARAIVSIQIEHLGFSFLSISSFFEDIVQFYKIKLLFKGASTVDILILFIKKTTFKRAHPEHFFSTIDEEPFTIRRCFGSTPGGATPGFFVRLVAKTFLVVQQAFVGTHLVLIIANAHSRS